MQLNRKPRKSTQQQFAEKAAYVYVCLSSERCSDSWGDEEAYTAAMLLKHMGFEPFGPIEFCDKGAVRRYFSSLRKSSLVPSVLNPNQARGPRQ